MATIGTDVQHAANLLASGQLVAIPTETVYGLAAHALQPEAVTKIFEAKNRPFFDPLIVHIGQVDQVLRYATAFPLAAQKLAERFWPGPLTLLLPRQSNIPDIATAGLPTVGLRCPQHPVLRQLLALIDFPLAAPSANPFGYVSPTTAAHVQTQLGSVIPYILDGGSSAVGIESTIVGFDEEITVYRLGGIAPEELESVVGPVRIRTQTHANPLAPGQLDSHYSPRKKLIVGHLPELLRQYQHVPVSVLSFQTDYQGRNQIILSPDGNLAQAAHRLFAALRTLDEDESELVLAEWVPEIGLGRAINDRLRRAAV
jgi:L-threonylcarbamoyladenylate synthase